MNEDTLYQTERYGAYRYEIPVTNSTYSLKLHFAELYHTAAGARLFNVTVEGEPVILSMDLYEDVGHDTALDVTVTDVMVADESLTIELTTEIDNATISGFAIYSDAGGKFVQPVEPEEPEGCDLPNNLSWTSSQAIISPKNGFANVKDPTIVYHDNKYHVFATAYSSSASAYQSIYLNFSSFDQASAAQHTTFAPGGSTVAPQVFYFRPQNRWYIITQWPAKYTTSTNISDPSSWSAVKAFWPGVNGGHAGALDYWVICDDSTCYMFFFKDDGKMYQVKTPINNFPNFDINQVTVSNVQGSGGQNILFEAGNVYKIRGQDKYLLQVEGWGASEGRRLYRSWTSTSLDGPWVAHKTTENDPFAGLNNVSFPGGQWSQQISHGEMIRAGSDETMELDACNMQFLYQGANLSGFNGSYDARPYKLGLLTAD